MWFGPEWVLESIPKGMEKGLKVIRNLEWECGPVCNSGRDDIGSGSCTKRKVPYILQLKQLIIAGKQDKAFC